MGVLRAHHFSLTEVLTLDSLRLSLGSLGLVAGGDRGSRNKT
jgi:hypothetical protein